ncbi:hypothetical protein LPJ53_001651 [Coemansia erecta]|uniref:Uncharacterized protein n=1 Tax=Coemansia erecta TaxID=147472 RepID=A0A9W8CSK7_9FUNG|nr:hypothetical protein LPJ53_001651 [Coemansia erecta]
MRSFRISGLSTASCTRLHSIFSLRWFKHAGARTLAKIGKLQEALDDKQNAIDELRAQLDAATSALEAASTDTDINHSEISELRKSLEIERDGSNELLTRFDEMAAAFEEVAADLEEVKRQNSDLNESLEVEQNNSDALLGRIKEKAAAFEAVSAERDIIQNENDDLRKSLDVMQSGSDELVTQIKQVAGAFESAKAELEETREQTDAIEHHAAELQMKLDAKEALLAAEHSSGDYCTSAAIGGQPSPVLSIAKVDKDEAGAAIGGQPSPTLSTAEMDKGKAGATDAEHSTCLSRHGRELDEESPRTGGYWLARFKRIEANRAQWYAMLMRRIGKMPANDMNEAWLKRIEATIYPSGMHGEAARAVYSY